MTLHFRFICVHLPYCFLHSSIMIDDYCSFNYVRNEYQIATAFFFFKKSFHLDRYADSSGISGEIPPTFANLKNLLVM